MKCENEVEVGLACRCCGRRFLNAHGGPTMCRACWAGAPKSHRIGIRQRHPTRVRARYWTGGREEKRKALEESIARINREIPHGTAKYI